MIGWGVCNKKSFQSWRLFLVTSGRSISRILSGNRENPALVRSSLWAACRHTARCGLPGTGVLPVEGAHMETSSLPPSADDFVPAWPCSRRGLPGHAHYCARRWSFTPPFHHHLLFHKKEGGCLLSVALSGRFTLLSGFPAPGAIRRRAL